MTYTASYHSYHASSKIDFCSEKIHFCGYFGFSRLGSLDNVASQTSPLSPLIILMKTIRRIGLTFRDCYILRDTSNTINIFIFMCVYIYIYIRAVFESFSNVTLSPCQTDPLVA